MVGERPLVRSGVHIPVTEWAQEVHSLPAASVSGGAAPEPLGPVPPERGPTAGRALTVRAGTVSLKHMGPLPRSRAIAHLAESESAAVHPRRLKS